MADLYHTRGMTDYDALKAYGHSPAKAAEILLDAQRGDGFCRGWIAVVRNALAGGAQSAETNADLAQSEGRQSGGRKPATPTPLSPPSPSIGSIDMKES